MENFCPSSPEGETVCAALARHENTLRDAIREIHVDVSTFKLGIERHLKETAALRAPFERAVAQLQQENQHLRSQLEALTRQVELLSGITRDKSTLLNNNHSQNHKNGLDDIQENHEDIKEVIYGKSQACTQSQAQLHVQTLGNQTQIYSNLSNQQSATILSSPTSRSPPANSRGSSMKMSPGSNSGLSVTRFSSRATFALCNKTKSPEREEPIEVDPVLLPTGQQNEHASPTEYSELVHEKISPSIDYPLEHTAPTAVRMSHLPITATTKTAEMKDFTVSTSSPLSSPGSETSSTSQSITSPSQAQPAGESPVQPVPSIRTWTSTPTRAPGSPSLQAQKRSSAPATPVAYSGIQLHDRQMGERRQEVVRSQTLPHSIGAQARRTMFQRVDSETTNCRPKPVTLKRSQSFGVSSASSIKQILLEWCRSKTIGYQNIDIQNFSSSWSDGMAFCALIHSFFPTEFDYNSLSPANRKHNFELAFGIAEKKASCDRLIEVEDMIIMGRKPDPMCVFTYIQSLYNHLRPFET